MSDEETIVIRLRDYYTLIGLAWAGVNDGAGIPEEINAVEHWVERRNPIYAEICKADRARRHAELLEKRKQDRENKIWARKHSGEEMYLLLGEGKARIKVKIVGWSKAARAIDFRKIGDIEFDDSLRETGFMSLVVVPAFAKKKDLTSLDAQFGKPKPQVQKAYVPGGGRKRSGGTLDET